MNVGGADLPINNIRDKRSRERRLGNSTTAGYARDRMGGGIADGEGSQKFIPQLNF